MNKKGIVMERGSTVFLRGVVMLMGIAALALCIFVLPAGFTSDDVGYYRPILLGLYITALPFFVALYQALKLLDYIDKNKAFSHLSVTALKRIKYCGLTISALLAAGTPYVYDVVDKDDAPGALMAWLVIIGVSFVIAVFATLMQKILQDAIAIKSENDLTV